MTVHGPFPPGAVRHPVMRHRWESTTFLHWAYPVETVAAFLPRGLEVEARDGRAWVGLVLFRMYVRLPAGPTWNVVPPFPETNLRTYVVGPGGRPGIWFFSLDAASPSAVAAARGIYGLPYFDAAMRLDDGADTIRYTSKRRWPGPRGAGHDVEISVAAAMPAGDLREFDHYLTARFTLWHRDRGRLIGTDVEHDPWPWRRAHLLRYRQDLLRATGLPDPAGEPIVHFSPGVDVRIGPPRLHRRP
jgi:uncharacterized protein YqjF (DUF2071 family)